MVLSSNDSVTETDRPRCWWCGTDPIYQNYHDTEWGVPQHNDQALFEMLLLEGFQAGLSWLTILKKRDNFRKAYCNFNPVKIASFNAADEARLLSDPGIVRNKLKVNSSIQNARGFLRIQEEFGSFDSFIWGFTAGKTIVSSPRPTRSTIIAKSKESDAISKELKKRGFNFVGSTIIYAHMQATGMVDDHVDGCFKAK